MSHIETHTVKLDVRNRKTETLFEGHVHKLNISTFWDSHGTSVPFPGRNNRDTEQISNCDVKIIKQTSEIYWSATNITPHESWNLEVNGKIVPGDVTFCKGDSENLRVRICVGAG